MAKRATKGSGPTGFERGRNGGTKVCQGCGKRTWKSAGEGTDLCDVCYDEAGLENAHSDGHHEDAPHPDCGACHARMTFPLGPEDLGK